MVQRVVADSAGRDIVFEFMIRILFVHVFGVRQDAVGLSRGTIRKVSMDILDVTRHLWRSLHNRHVRFHFGSVSAGEAHGRGSLHPHILV